MIVNLLQGNVSNGGTAMILRTGLIYLIFLLVIGVATSAALADDCGCSAGSPNCKCACKCNYIGPREGGGSGNCIEDRNCNEGQTATCSCGSSGCTSSCSSHKNQQLLDPEDLFENVQLTDTTLAGVCSWVGHLDENWDCIIQTTNTSSVTTQFSEQTYTFEEVISLIAAEYGGCAEIDESELSLSFRPAGTCL
jgi:hypothetical protein